MIKPIVKYPDPILSTPCERASFLDKDIQRLVDDMFDTMDANKGIGLAANQIGVSLRVIVVDITNVPRESSWSDEITIAEWRGPCEKVQSYTRFALINPVVAPLASSPRVKAREGCLSCPGASVKITRRDSISVKASDAQTNEVRFWCSGWLSRVIQHEVDHLNGLTIRNARPDV